MDKTLWLTFLGHPVQYSSNNHATHVRVTFSASGNASPMSTTQQGGVRYITAVEKQARPTRMPVVILTDVNVNKKPSCR